MTIAVRTSAGPLLLLMAALMLSACQRHGQVAAREPSLGTSHDLAPSAAPAAEPLASEAAEPALLSTREPWTYEDAAGHLILTPNYRVYTTLTSQLLLNALPELYERALAHYTSALGELPQPREPLHTYLFQTRSQWQSKTQEMLPDQAEMFASLGRGGFTTRGTSVLYYIDRRGTRDTFAIAAHEGWHQYTQRTFKQQLPIWLEEGVATYMEGYTSHDGLPEFDPTQNRERRLTLSRAMRDENLIDLHDLLTRTPQDFLGDSKTTLLVYYAQTWGLIRFLAEGEDRRYRAALSQVLRDAADGRLVGRMFASPSMANVRRRGAAAAARIGTAVVEEYFNPSLVEFEAQYLAFIAQLVERRQGDDWRR